MAGRLARGIVDEDRDEGGIWGRMDRAAKGLERVRVVEKRLVVGG